MSYIKSTVIRHLKERSSTTNEDLEDRTYFSNFIEPNRNDLLKEYEGNSFLGRRCQRGREDASTDLVYVYANQQHNSYNQTLAVNYSADTIKNSNGIKVIPLSEMLSILEQHLDLEDVERTTASDS